MMIIIIKCRTICLENLQRATLDNHTQNTSSTYSYKIINDYFFPPQTTIQLLSLPHSLPHSLLCYLQTIQAINALTSPSDRHNYKKTEQCNSSIQEGLFEHSVTLLSYPSPCLKGNFSPQKRHKERGRRDAPQPRAALCAPAGKPSPWLVLGNACSLEKDWAPRAASSGATQKPEAPSMLWSPISGALIPGAPASAQKSQG